MKRARRRCDGTAGFSLVEVIIALALLGGVLIAVSGLLVLAGRQVHGGRNQTTALSVARDVLEELSTWSFERLHDEFGLSAAEQGTVDTRTDAFADKWQPLLDRELADAHAEILIQSIDGTPNPPVLADARSIRIVVTVSWSEGDRSRSVQLATVR